MTLALAGCVAPAPPPPPPPVVATPRPVPTPPARGDWRDRPATPGTWTYRPDGPGRSVATFGTGPRATVFAMACNTTDRTVTLSVAGGAGAQPLTIRTSSTTRTLPTIATPRVDGWPPVTHDARLAAADPLLDAMGFSRGRFAIERPGTPPLAIPAWPELLRVVEDCRG